MKFPPQQAIPPNIEFLPLSAAPAGCGFKLIADVLAENGLSNSIDLLAALRDGLNPAVYATDGGEMLGDPGAWGLGLNIVVASRDAEAERAGRAA